jgi:drug/metabolite transporter (DMT)-like permease
VLIAANVVAVRYSNRELSPLWGAGSRFTIASFLFIFYVTIKRLPLPRGRALVGTLLFGVFQFGIGFALAYWALLEVPAGLASVVLASVTLFTLVFASIAGIERFTIKGLLGSIVAIIGMAFLFRDQAGDEIPAKFLLAALGAAASFAMGLVVVKGFPKVHPATMNGLGMLTGALILLGLSLLFGETWGVPRDPATWIAYLYLVLAGSVGVFALLLFILKRWTATGVSYQTVLSPIIAIVLSSWLLDETISGGLFLGASLVITGVYIGALMPSRRTS